VERSAAGTKSFALICHDFDVPSQGDDVQQAGSRGAGRPAARRLLPLGHGRLARPRSPELAEGQFSRGFTAQGQARAPRWRRLPGARHGLNDYTGWFAGNAEMAGTTSATTARFRRSTIR
jgi:hypothetical protein